MRREPDGETGWPERIEFAALLATFVGGAIEISGPFLHALNLMVLLTLGGLAGLFLATLSTGTYLEGSLFATGYLHLLLGGGATAGLITGLSYWWPKLMGRSTGKFLGKTSAGLIFAGSLIAFFPGLIAGSRGLSSLTLFSSPVSATLDRVGTLGSVILVLGLALVGWDLLASMTRGAASATNPWGATTGEWQDRTAVPEAGRDGAVQTYDFSALPAVRAGHQEGTAAASGDMAGKASVASE